MSDDLMTIRQMCEAFDVTARTLRFYESKELLTPHREGNRRLYNRRDRARLKLILRGKRFGFSLEEIRQLLDLYNSPGGPALQYRRVYDAAQERLQVLVAERAKLTETIDALKEMLDWGAQALHEYEASRSAAE